MAASHSLAVTHNLPRLWQSVILSSTRKQLLHYFSANLSCFTVFYRWSLSCCDHGTMTAFGNEQTDSTSEQYITRTRESVSEQIYGKRVSKRVSEGGAAHPFSGLTQPPVSETRQMGHKAVRVLTR